MDESRRDVHEIRSASVGSLSVLPVFFGLGGKRTIVVGGSAAAAWKAELLAAAGSRVCVYAPDPGQEMSALAQDGDRVGLIARTWRDDDFGDAALAVADLPDAAEAARFAAAAKAAGVPANVIDQPDYSVFQFGAVVERSPLVVGISTAGAAPALAQAARARIEAALPQGLRDWAARAASWRPQLRSRRLDKGFRRRFWSQFAARAFSDAEKPPPQDDALADLMESAEDEQTVGSVVLVGAGPGDPDLLTLKAVRALQSADVVLYDDLASPETVAMARREAQRIAVGKRGYKPSCTQEDITALLIRLAREGKRVARLKGGDPLLFGRANEEMDALAAAGVPVEVVPGVTSASAAAAAVGRSLTERDLARRVQFVTAHAKNGRLPEDLNWAALADPGATTAVYMGLRTLPDFVARLLAEGLDPQTPAAAVENASRRGERRLVAPIADLPRLTSQARMTGPCLILIGGPLGKAQA
jgi:uroporphyrin-III C-methyltransferase / precorrin-2 dehydrogenase / sirohydrochlorin ferrochelatase